MQAADIKPSRFVATQIVVDDFITRRANDRIGAVIFGRDAYTLLPLTTDHQALRTLINELQLNMIDGQGTAIGNAIGVALNRLRHSDAKSKVVILATDGNSNSGNVSPLQAADFAHTLGVKVYTILMGRSSDALIQKGVDIFGRPLFDRGNFPINPELLKKVASQTRGEAFQVTDREGLERSFHTILDRLEKSQIEDAGRIYGELFPAFVWAALLLLLVEITLNSLVLRRWP
jgi:Ca-activated chloride channel family protein